MKSSSKWMAGVCLLTMMSVTACYTPQGLAVGSVPCNEDEMQIIDEKESILSSTESWTVICKDERYYCSARRGSNAPPAVNCVLVEE